MKRTIIFLLALFSITIAFSQNDSTSIDTYKSFLGYQYIQNDSTILMPTEMLAIFQNQSQASVEMTKARSRRITSQVFISTGSFVVGLAIVSSITGLPPKWEAIALGSSLIIIGIPFNMSFHKHAQSAVSIYNNGLTAKQSANLQFGITKNGVGLLLKL